MASPSVVSIPTPPGSIDEPTHSHRERMPRAPEPPIDAPASPPLSEGLAPLPEPVRMMKSGSRSPTYPHSPRYLHHGQYPPTTPHQAPSNTSSYPSYYQHHQQLPHVSNYQPPRPIQIPQEYPQRRQDDRYGGQYPPTAPNSAHLQQPQTRRPSFAHRYGGGSELVRRISSQGYASHAPSEMGHPRQEMYPFEDTIDDGTVYGGRLSPPLSGFVGEPHSNLDGIIQRAQGVVTSLTLSIPSLQQLCDRYNAVNDELQRYYQINADQDKDIEELQAKERQLEALKENMEQSLQMNTAEINRLKLKIADLESDVKRLNASIESKDKERVLFEQKFNQEREALEQEFQKWKEETIAAHDNEKTSMVEGHDAEKRNMLETFVLEKKSLEETHGALTKELETSHVDKVQEIVSLHESRVEELEATHAAMLKELEESHAMKVKAVEEAFAVEKKDMQDVFSAEKVGMEEEFAMEKTGMEGDFAAEKLGMEDAWADEKGNIKDAFAVEKQRIEAEFESEKIKMTEDFASQKLSIEEDFASQKKAIEDHFAAQKVQLQETFESEKAAMISTFEAAKMEWGEEKEKIISDFKDERTRLDEIIKSLEEDKQNLECCRLTLEADKAGLEGEKAILLDEKSTLLGEKTALQDEKTGLEGAVATLEDKAAALEGDKEVLISENEKAKVGWGNEKAKLLEMIDQLECAKNSLLNDNNKLVETLKGVAEEEEGAEIRSRGDCFYIDAFQKLAKDIIDISGEFSNLPISPPSKVLAELPSGLPSMLGNGDASRLIRMAYVQHIISKYLCHRIFQPFLFSLGKRYDKADTFFQSMSNQLREKSTRKEAVWRHYTLLAGYTASNAKKNAGVAASGVIEEIAGYVKPFADQRNMDVITSGITRIVKFAVETWRYARMEREIITASMSTDDTDASSWEPHNYERQSPYLENVMLTSQLKAAAQGRTMILPLLPVFSREGTLPTLYRPLAVLDSGLVFSKGTALYTDCLPILQRRWELNLMQLPIPMMFKDHLAQLEVNSAIEEVKEEATAAETPVAEASTIVEEASVAVEELLTEVEETPAVAEGVTAVVKETLVAVEETLTVVEETSVAAEEVPGVIEEVHTVAEKVPIVVGEIPAVVEDIRILENAITDAEEPSKVENEAEKTIEETLREAEMAVEAAKTTGLETLKEVETAPLEVVGHEHLLEVETESAIGGVVTEVADIPQEEAPIGVVVGGQEITRRDIIVDDVEPEVAPEGVALEEVTEVVEAEANIEVEEELKVGGVMVDEEALKADEPEEMIVESVICGVSIEKEEPEDITSIPAEETIIEEVKLTEYIAAEEVEESPEVHVEEPLPIAEGVEETVPESETVVLGPGGTGIEIVGLEQAEVPAEEGVCSPKDEPKKSSKKSKLPKKSGSRKAKK